MQTVSNFKTTFKGPLLIDALILRFVQCIILTYMCMYFFVLQNKAIVAINARTSEILTANDMAAELFGYSTQRLIGIKMSQLFADVHKEKQEALVEQHIEASGAVVMVNGKVVSLRWNTVFDN